LKIGSRADENFRIAENDEEDIDFSPDKLSEIIDGALENFFKLEILSKSQDPEHQKIVKENNHLFSNVSLSGTSNSQNSQSNSNSKNFANRTNFLKNLPKNQSTVEVNNDDKNRIEHCERFWSAVSEFVGEIPKETLEFLKNLSEIRPKNDIDMQGRSHNLDGENMSADEFEPEEFQPAFKKLKTSKTELPSLQEWERKLYMRENVIIGQNISKTVAGLDNNENELLEENDNNDNIDFPDLTQRICSALITENIETESVTKIMEKLKNGENLAESVTSSSSGNSSGLSSSAQSENSSSNSSPESVNSGKNSNSRKNKKSKQFQIKADHLVNSLDLRIAQELYKNNLMSEEDLQSYYLTNFKNSGDDDNDDDEVDQPSQKSKTKKYSDPRKNEIQAEIINLQNQLKMVQKESATIARNLHKKAINHNKKHKAFKSLENIDYNLLEMYRKVLQHRSKRKNISRKERELICEEIEKRVDVIDKLFD